MAYDRERIERLTQSGAITKEQASELYASLDNLDQAPSSPLNTQTQQEQDTNTDPKSIFTTVAAIALCVITALMFNAITYVPAPSLEIQNVSDAMNSPNAVGGQLSVGWTVFYSLIFFVFLPGSIVWLYWIYIYNSLCKMGACIRKSFSEISVKLQKRQDLTTSLRSATEEHFKLEAAAQNSIADSRSNNNHTNELASLCQQLEDLQSLSSSKVSKKEIINVFEHSRLSTLNGINAVIESYPNLKTAEHFSALISELIQLENQLDMARRTYNEYVSAYQAKISSIPESIIAKFYKFPSYDYFQVSSTK